MLSLSKFYAVEYFSYFASNYYYYFYFSVQKLHRYIYKGFKHRLSYSFI